MSNVLEVARRIAATNPWLKWAVVVLIGLFAIEFIAQRGIALYVQLETARLQVEATNNKNRAAVVGLPKDFFGAPLEVPLDIKPKK